ncbi:MAG: hypothetical protein H6581_19195 [Bacteroidia bacterium]|nr:hypothetical protein [Bacteroidia bacterium]
MKMNARYDVETRIGKVPAHFPGAFFLLIVALFSCKSGSGNAKFTSTDLASADHLIPIEAPYLPFTPKIDGDLSEWKNYAFTDGMWDLQRVSKASWYDPHKNRLTDHGNEPPLEMDLAARYYLAWDDESLYLGAEVFDNVNDVTESKHAPKRWYYKDAVAWFFEMPADSKADTFGTGDHGFAFIADSTYPDYGAWWRHGTLQETFVEEPLPKFAGEYRLTFNPWGRSAADYVLEARIDLPSVGPRADPMWKRPKMGQKYKMMIVHCDPDGGEYGGHLLIYGKGDPDQTWRTVVLSKSIESIERKEK